MTATHGTLAESEYNKLLTRCRELPLAKGNYLESHYVSNLLLTVLDFWMNGTTVGRAIYHYKHYAMAYVEDFTALKRFLSKYPDTKDGNLHIAQFLWGYRYRNRVSLLRRLVDYFESIEVTTADALTTWAKHADFERDFRGRVKGAGYAIFKWLVMRQGVETVKPDIWIHRFIKATIGRSISDTDAVKVLENIAKELEVPAYKLDWGIWEYQRSL